MSKELPTLEMPGFDGIGANEYIVDVTHPGTVDFISAVDTPYVWELNIWYHTLNVGFRTRIAGETDFPCIYDGRVGIGRTYSKIDGPMSYLGWLKGLQSGYSYVSDGKTHLMNFRVNGAARVRREERSARRVRRTLPLRSTRRPTCPKCRTKPFANSRTTRSPIGTWSARGLATLARCRWRSWSMGRPWRGRTWWPMEKCAS